MHLLNGYEAVVSKERIFITTNSHKTGTSCDFTSIDGNIAEILQDSFIKYPCDAYECVIKAGCVRTYKNV